MGLENRQPTNAMNHFDKGVKGKGLIRSILNPLAGKFSEDTRKKGKGEKTGASHDWRIFYLSQYDWLKGSHMTKVVWLPNETGYSYCEFVSPILPIRVLVWQPQSIRPWGYDWRETVKW